MSNRSPSAPADFEQWPQPHTVCNLDFYRQYHGQQLYYRWEGSVAWRPTPDSDLEPLFAIAGMNATKVFLRTDPVHGEVGYRINRELGLYCHRQTRDVLYHWQTPQGESVPVVPIANRIVQGQVTPKTTTIPAGQPVVETLLSIPLTYPHPLADYPKYCDYCPGATFTGTEYFTTYTRRPEFTGSVPPPTWARDCPWLPWMKLGYGHPARLRFETTIERVDRFEDLNPQLIAVIRDRVPLYQHTPDHSDEPNVTSTTYFKQHFDAYQAGATFPIAERA